MLKYAGKCDYCKRWAYDIVPVDWEPGGDPVVSQRFQYHVDNCDQCLCDSLEYCPIGDSLEAAWLDTIEE